MASVRSVRLTQSPAPAATKRQRSSRSVPEPDRNIYGVFGPNYASYLANTAAAQDPTDSAALAALNAGALQSQAEQERAEYAAMLGRAQDLQQRLAREEGYFSMQEDALDALHGDVDRGMGGARKVVWDEATGLPTTVVDPIATQIANANKLNTDQAERFGTYAGAVDTLRKSGVDIGDEYLRQLFTPPTQVEEVPLTTGTTPLTPDDTTERYGTDEGLSFEEQLRLALAKGSDGDESDDVGEVKLNHGATGEVPTLEYKGTPEQIARARQRMIDNGFDPDTGQKINPSAGEQGGGSPANQAAPKNKTTERIQVVPSAGFFAPDKITSKKGMRKHPILGVNRMHEGDDYAYPKGTPIPAERNGTVLFAGPVKGFGNQVKVRYEDGSVVSYSHNAANTVKIGDKIRKGQVIGKVGSTGLSTGSHVHRQVHNQGNPEKVYATRLKSHPLVADVKVVDDKTLVTMRDGTQRVYQRGRRVGG